MKKILFSFLSLLALAGCQKEEITLDTHVSDVFFLRNNGASMPIRVHGNTAGKTFMLMVHGGPGGEDIVYRVPFVREYVESEIAVVYWDQRNSGSSQGSSNGSYNTVDDFVQDMEKVITLLKHRYGTDISIFVNGHSWGGYLTPAFLQKGNNQYTVKGWIQTSGAHNIPLVNEYSRQMQLEFADSAISDGRDVEAWTEIRDYCNKITLPLSLKESLTLNKHAHKSGSLVPEINEPPYSSKEFANIYSDNKISILHNTLQGIYNPVTYSIIEQVFGEGGAEVSANMNKITIPTLLLYGKYDFICPAKLAEDIESRIQSTYKKKVIFEHSGHSSMISEEKAYWAEVLAFINEFR